MQKSVATQPVQILSAFLALALPGAPALASDAGSGTGLVADAAAGEIGQKYDDLGQSEGNGAKVQDGKDDGSGYQIELGILPHYLDNYYQTQDDFGIGSINLPPKSVGIVTLSAGIDYRLLNSKDRKLTAGVEVRHDLYTDLDHANSTNFEATLVYETKPSMLKIGYFGARHRLVSDSGGNFVYGTKNGLSADYAYRVTKQLRAKAGYRFTRDTYSSSTSRNLSDHNFSAELRYKIVSQFMPAIGFEYSRGNTASSSYSYKRKAVYASVTSEFGNVAYLNFRYRHSQRDYLTGIPTDSYFGRKDPRDDLSFYGTLQLGHGLSAFGYATHIDNGSNQISHRFKSNEAGVGLFYRL